MNAVRFAVRRLLKQPGFTLVTVLVLGLGIGANVTIFTFLDRLLLRPVTLPDAGRVLAVWATEAGQAGRIHDRLGVTPADFRDWQEQSTTLETIAAFVPSQMEAGGEGEAEQLGVARVTASFFATLGMNPGFGAGFGADRETPGRDGVAILSHRTWQRRYGGAADVIGRPIRLAGQPHTIVGVMPADFDYPTGCEVWVPLALTTGEWARRDLGLAQIQVLGRLKDGVTMAQAKQELTTISQRLAAAYPQTNARRGVRPLSLQERAVIESGSTVPMALAAGATIFLLLLVCANLANVQLARGLERAREFAIRAALGASRSRLAGQLLAENAVLAVSGGTLGVALAFLGIRAMRTAMPAEIAQAVPGWKFVSLDGRTLLWTCGFVLITAVLAGLAPSLVLSQPPLSETLKEGGHQATSSRRRQVLRHGLVALQVAVALVLLTGNGLLMKAFLAQASIGTSFPVDRVLGFEVSLPASRYPDREAEDAWRQRAIAELAAIPGVEAVGVGGRSALDQWFPKPVEFENAPAAPAGQPQRLPAQCVTPGWFQVMDQALRAGRAFDERDQATAPAAAVLTESAARRFFLGEDPIGRRFQTVAGTGVAPEWFTIVGVVADARVGPQSTTPEAVFFPLTQQPGRQFTVLVRSKPDARTLTPAVRERMQQLDPDLPLLRMLTLRETLVANLGGLRVLTSLLAVTGFLALGLAALGLYGVVARTVTQRRAEIGIRLALGAQRNEVVRLVLTGGLKLALLGLLPGLPLALGLGWVLAAQFGSELPIARVEPLSLALVTGLLLLVACLATLLPARRAACLDPMETLRSE